LHERHLNDSNSNFLSNHALEIRSQNLKDAQRLRVQKDHGASNCYRVHRNRGNHRSATGKDSELGISHDEQTVVINIEEGVCNCTCNDLADYRIACKHIIAALIHLRKNHYLQDYSKAHMFYHKCYLVENIKNAYKESIKTLWGPILEKTNTMGPIVGSKSHLGKRIRSAHNRHQSKKTGRVLKKCSICRFSNHTRRKCPMRDLSVEDRKQALADIFENTGSPSIPELKRGKEVGHVQAITYVDVPFAKLANGEADESSGAGECDEEDNTTNNKPRRSLAAAYSQVKRQRHHLQSKHFLNDTGCENVGGNNNEESSDEPYEETDDSGDAEDDNSTADDEESHDEKDSEEEDTSDSESFENKEDLQVAEQHNICNNSSSSSWYETILQSFNAFHASRKAKATVAQQNFSNTSRRHLQPITNKEDSGDEEEVANSEYWD
jgi:hypothetical protein